jgi:hypothetical protein
MADEIFPYGFGVKPTTGFTRAPGVPFGLAENPVGKGNRRFHTVSITIGSGKGKVDISLSRASCGRVD